MVQVVKSKNANDAPDGSALYQSVQIIIDPKVRDLDKTIGDILQISSLISEKLPIAKIMSIAVNDYFATVKAAVPKELAFKEITIRLYEIKGVWEIRGNRVT